MPLFTSDPDREIGRRQLIICLKHAQSILSGRVLRGLPWVQGLGSVQQESGDEIGRDPRPRWLGTSGACSGLILAAGCKVS